MKAYAIPDRVRALIFDVDSTLYTCPAYAEAQTRCQIERLAALRGVSYGSMETRIEAVRARWAAEHGGAKLSLGNAFVSLGISIEESARWRDELIEPERYLAPDPKLRSTLSGLRGRFRMAVVTNNPEKTARRTLAALGVEDLFQAIVALDTCGVSKPHREPFLRAAAMLKAEPAACVAVGDRYDIDIALPLEMGMGGVLVDGVEDVYRLPSLLPAGCV